jgi:hypothetical protein
VVDEDHDTGEIWGLLHFGCNRRIDQATRRYLREPPPVRLTVPADRQRAAERRRRQKARRARAGTRTSSKPPVGYAEQIAAATQGRNRP